MEMILLLFFMYVRFQLLESITGLMDGNELLEHEAHGSGLIENFGVT